MSRKHKKHLLLNIDANSFEFKALQTIKVRGATVSYPPNILAEEVRFSSSMLIDDYFENVLSENDALQLTENCKCFLFAELTKEGKLLSSNITAVFFKTESKCKKWVYLRFDIECKETADLSSHFLPHLHLCIQEGKECVRIDDIKLPGPMVTNRIIYDCLSMIHRMADSSDWLKQRRSFAEKNFMHNVLETMDDVKKQQDRLGEKIATDEAFRKNVIKMNELIDRKMNVDEVMSIPLSSELLEMRKVYSYYGENNEIYFNSLV